jgi:hypothetical protein
MNDEKQFVRADKGVMVHHSALIVQHSRKVFYDRKALGRKIYGKDR